MKDEKWGLHWFRRDLRVDGNLALIDNAKQMGGRTLGIFCFDSKFLSRSDFSYNRFAFFLKTLESLRADLRECGGDLLVVDQLPIPAFKQLLDYCNKNGLQKPSLVTFNSDYEPFARERDKDVSDFFRDEGIPITSNRDHLLFEPHEIRRTPNEDDFYKVYSPWSKKWFAAMTSDEGSQRIRAIADRTKRDRPKLTLQWKTLANKDFPFEDAYSHFERENNKHVKIRIPEAGFEAGMKEIRKFKAQLKDYLKDRDYPDRYGTSQLSLYLKNGSITIAHVLHELDLYKVDSGGQTGPSKYAKELAWREFYYSILYHRPDVETGPFQTKYRKVKWVEDDELFQAWKDGQTGVPIVDAGMRELKNSGWITNRVRIIVSSFMTKDLLLNWQWGERHFMNLLIDGDLAPNNGNWQWAASTGSDPNPYFRILSPWLQGKKFDPNGDYIRKHVPELRDAPAKILHDPYADRSAFQYRQPIVDHAEQRPLAIAMFKGL